MTTGDALSQIDLANRMFEAAFGRGDAAAVAALYTKGGQVLPAHSDVVEGSQAILSFWQGAIRLGLKGVALETVEVDVLGDTAIEMGRYQLLAAGGTRADHGKYLVVWKNEGGAWRIHRDIFTTSQASASAASA